MPIPSIVLLVLVGTFCLIGFVIIAVRLSLCCIISIMGSVWLVSRNVLVVLARLLRVLLARIRIICIMWARRNVCFSVSCRIIGMGPIVWGVSFPV